MRSSGTILTILSFLALGGEAKKKCTLRSPSSSLLSSSLSTVQATSSITASETSSLVSVTSASSSTSTPASSGISLSQTTQSTSASTASVSATTSASELTNASGATSTSISTTASVSTSTTQATSASSFTSVSETTSTSASTSTSDSSTISSSTVTTASSTASTGSLSTTSSAAAVTSDSATLGTTSTSTTSTVPAEPTLYRRYDLDNGPDNSGGWRPTDQNMAVRSKVDSAFSQYGSNSWRIDFMGPSMIRMGMFMSLESGLVEVGKTYSLSGWFYATQFNTGHCDTVILSCGWGNNYFSSTAGQYPASSALNQWHQFQTTCSWTAMQLQTGMTLITLGWVCGGASTITATGATAWIDTVELQEVRA